MSAVYQLITDRIITLLEQGVIPWRKPWKGGNNKPCNLFSKKAYRGINIALLACAPYSKPWWITFRQAQQLGGTVRRGERGFPIIFWTWLGEKKAEQKKNEKKENSEKDKTGKIPLLRYYTVFNVAQCDGLDEHLPSTEKENLFQPIESAEAILNGMHNSPEICHGHGSASYSPSLDLIRMPSPEMFNPREEYYSTLFHEITHATGHNSRLARTEIEEMQAFGSHSYSREELVAEFGACFLCGHSGIEAQTLENSTSYIGGWLERVKEDKRLVITAAARAQKAVDYVLDGEPSFQENR